MTSNIFISSVNYRATFIQLGRMGGNSSLFREGTRIHIGVQEISGSVIGPDNGYRPLHDGDTFQQNNRELGFRVIFEYQVVIPREDFGRLRYELAF